jgi:hypothetical protein
MMVVVGIHTAMNTYGHLAVMFFFTLLLLISRSAAQRLFSPAARMRGDAFAKRTTTMRVEQLESPPIAQSGAKLG